MMGSNIDIGRAVGAPFKDAGWVTKTLLGGVFVLLGVTVPAAMGAMLVYIKGVATGNEDLPEWNDFGGLWVRGFLAGLAGFIYALPAIILFGIALVPIAVGTLAAGNSGDAGGAIAAALSGGCLLIAIAGIYTIGVSVLIYGAYVNYAITGEFGSMFAFGEIMARIRSGGGYFVAWVFSIAVSFGVSIVTSVLSSTVIGLVVVPFASFLGMMMTGHLFGQWAANTYGLAPAPVAAAPASYAPPAYAPPAAPPAPPGWPAAPTSSPSETAAASPSAPPTAPPTAAPPMDDMSMGGQAPGGSPFAPPPAPPAPPAAPAPERSIDEPGTPVE